MIRVVLDTSVLVAAVISASGPNAKLFQAIVEDKIRPYVTGIDIIKNVSPLFIGGARGLYARIGVLEGDGDARRDGAGAVADKPLDTAAEFLRKRQCCADEQPGEKRPGVRDLSINQPEGMMYPNSDREE